MINLIDNLRLGDFSIRHTSPPLEFLSHNRHTIIQYKKVILLPQPIECLFQLLDLTCYQLNRLGGFFLVWVVSSGWLLQLTEFGWEFE